jgi:hypothetical protein
MIHTPPNAISPAYTICGSIAMSAEMSPTIAPSICRPPIGILSVATDTNYKSLPIGKSKVFDWNHQSRSSWRTSTSPPDERRVQDVSIGGMLDQFGAEIRDEGEQVHDALSILFGAAHRLTPNCLLIMSHCTNHVALHNPHHRACACALAGGTRWTLRPSKILALLMGISILALCLGLHSTLQGQAVSQSEHRAAQ